MYSCEREENWQELKLFEFGRAFLFSLVRKCAKPKNVRDNLLTRQFPAQWACGSLLEPKGPVEFVYFSVLMTCRRDRGSDKRRRLFQFRHNYHSVVFYFFLPVMVSYCSSTWPFSLDSFPRTPGHFVKQCAGIWHIVQIWFICLFERPTAWKNNRVLPPFSTCLLYLSTKQSLLAEHQVKFFVNTLP